MKGGLDLSETGRLFVRNLPFTVVEEDLDAAFGKFGALRELHLPRDGQQRVKVSERVVERLVLLVDRFVSWMIGWLVGRPPWLPPATCHLPRCYR